MKINATIVQYQQGSDAWLQHRAKSLNASELASAMGLSSYLKRMDLIAQKATGLTPEVDGATQRRFDMGHEYEAMARPWAEEIIGDDLYPCVLAADVDGLPLSASLDGQTMVGDVTWEHKTGNANLLASLEAGVIPDEYHPQMEQGLMLSGASRCLFMASSGDKGSMRYAWYESRPELRAKIIPTWKQFQQDLATYVPSTVEVKPIGRTPDNLPALRIEVTGAVTASNLAEYKAHALDVFKGINRELTTDQHFADAEKVVKWCGDVETRLAAAKEHALSQTASIDELFKAIDDISAEARRTRLELDKLVKARKEQIRESIVADGRRALAEHLASLNERLGKPYMPTLQADFAGAIKGKRTIDSLRDAVSTTLANAKIEASATADRIQINMGTLRELAKDHQFLFADTAGIVLKAPEDLTALVKSRIADHMAAEAKRLEAERERIRAEEQARIEREQREAAEAEQRKREAEERDARAQAEAKAAAEAECLMQEAAKPPAPPVSLVATNNAARAEIKAQATQEAATVKLGEICAMVGPGFSMTAAFVADILGVEHSATDKAAKLYKPSDVALICDELIQRLSKISAGQLKAA